MLNPDNRRNHDMKLDTLVSELITEQDWRNAWPVLVAYRPQLKLDDLLARREELQSEGYKLIGLCIQDQVKAMAGIQVLPHILGSKDLRVHDLATHPDERRKGYGEQLMGAIVNLARQLKCSRILLYSRLSNTNAHRFYEKKAGLERYGIEFKMELGETPL